MRNLKFIIGLALILTLLVPNEKSYATSETYIVTPDIGVNLRDKPNADSNIVNKLKQGTKVKITNTSGEWSKVSVNKDVGYIKSEYLKEFTQDLGPIYSYYDSILNNYTSNTHTYFLIYDFTQDGIEELYIADFEDSNHHKLYSGKKLLVDEYLEGGLTVYSDEYNYYLVSDSGMNRGDSVTDNAIKTDFNYDSLWVNTSYEWEEVIHPGNLRLGQTSISNEWNQFTEYELAGETYYLDPSIETTEYFKNKKKISKKEYDAFRNLYKNAINNVRVASFDGLSITKNEDYTSNLEQTKEHLKNLYDSQISSDEKLPYSDEQISEIENYIYLHISGAGQIYNENNEFKYVNLIHNFVGLYAASFGEEIRDHFHENTTVINENQHEVLNKDNVDNWLYTFYGSKIDNTQLNKELEEDLNGDIIYWELQGDTYICYCDGLGSPPVTPKLFGITALENDFYAIEYGEYWAEDSLLGPPSSKGVIVVKKVTTLENEVHYPYIKTYDSLDAINETEINTYANQLDIVIDNTVNEDKIVITEQAVTAAPKETQEDSKKSNSNLWIPLLIGILLLASIFCFLIYKNKKK